jgi:hypothetical protein
MAKSFKAALAAYQTTPHPADGASLPRLRDKDIAHLKRWLADERADEVWKTIDRAAQDHGTPVPVRFFIQETLATRKFAESITKHRQMDRIYFRKYANEMVRIASFLETPLPNGVLLILPAWNLLGGLLKRRKNAENLSPFLET